MSSYIKINSEEKKRNLIAMLNGDVDMIGSLLKQNNGKPLPVFDVSWGDEYFYFDSYQFAYVLYDALLFDDHDTDYRGRNIPEMLDLHKRICGLMKHPDYGKISFVDYNDWDYFSEEDIAELKKDGVRDIDIELTNEGIQHREEKVIELLKNGASPYFLNHSNWGPNYQPYGYLEVAFLLCHLDSEWCDQWDIRSLALLRKDINTLTEEDLEEIVKNLFDAAASQRILYIVDKHITDEARAKGEELMRKYDVYHPILRRKPMLS